MQRQKSCLCFRFSTAKNRVLPARPQLYIRTYVMRTELQSPTECIFSSSPVAKTAGTVRFCFSCCTYVHRIRTRKNPVKCTTWVPICFKKSPSLICPEHLRPFRRTFLRTHTVTGSPSPPDWYKIDIDSIDALYQICQTATENVTFFCWSKASGKDK